MFRQFFFEVYKQSGMQLIKWTQHFNLKKTDFRTFINQHIFILHEENEWWRKKSYKWEQQPDWRQKYFIFLMYFLNVFLFRAMYFEYLLMATF